MNIILNGERHETGSRTLGDLLREQGILSPDGTAFGYAFSVNQRLVPREQADSFELSEGDEVDIFSMVAGG